MHFPIPYPAIECHGVIGDRRTAALVSHDGTIDWLCLPDYDGDIIFGSLLDSRRGGFWRFGPATNRTAKVDRQTSWGAHTLRWETSDAVLELLDVMAWPADDHAPARARQAVLRRLRCVHGRLACEMAASPARNYSPLEIAQASPDVVRWELADRSMVLWGEGQLSVRDSMAVREFMLEAGEVAWAVLAVDDDEPWSRERAERVLREAHDDWSDWMDSLSYRGPHEDAVRRAGMLIHLLSYAPSGSVVAAPTTSLPERIGADWNADYRFAWVRDASLSLTALSWLGNTNGCKHYLEWLCSLGSSTAAPLQPLYGIRGETVLEQHERRDLYGYRGSTPIRIQNHACQQFQLDAFGYLAECMSVYLEHGGSWEPEFWELLERTTDYVAKHWTEAGNGIWELPKVQHYLSGKVMSWVALDRAMQVAQRLGRRDAVKRWRGVRAAIHADVLERGWSKPLRAFKQRYEGENLDAAGLLVAVMDFLPADDWRVRSTVDQIADRLAIDTFVYRFDPRETPEIGELPLGEYEGAFLPCTFWLAVAYTKLGDFDRAEEILRAAEQVASVLGLFSEGVDARSRCALGNAPLLFSHVEYVRAVTVMQSFAH